MLLVTHYFKSASPRRGHVAIHSASLAEMLFSCEVCGNRYPSISGLKKHMQINHDEAPALQNQVVIIVSVNIVIIIM